MYACVLENITDYYISDLNDNGNNCKAIMFLSYAYKGELFRCTAKLNRILLCMWHNLHAIQSKKSSYYRAIIFNSNK